MRRKQVEQLAKERGFTLLEVTQFYTHNKNDIDIIKIFKPKYVLLNNMNQIVGFGKNPYEISSYMKGDE